MQYSVYLHEIVAVDNHHVHAIPFSVATSLSWYSELLECSLSLENSLRTVAFIP